MLAFAPAGRAFAITAPAIATTVPTLATPGVGSELRPRTLESQQTVWGWRACRPGLPGPANSDQPQLEHRPRKMTSADSTVKSSGSSGSGTACAGTSKIA